jgi:hypothetical protein
VVWVGEEGGRKQRQQQQSHGEKLGDAAGVAGNPGPEVRALLGHRAGDGGALHLALVVHYDPRTVLYQEKGLDMRHKHSWFYFKNINFFSCHIKQKFTNTGTLQ